MIESFVAGAAAGYAIAIPVGAIAVLIVELGVRRGFALAAAAGTGAATADGIYATIAMVGGNVVAGVIAPFEGVLRIVAAGVLLGVALRGFIFMLLGPRGTPGNAQLPSGLLETYVRFLAITLLNPMTVIYFAALMLGLPQLGGAAGGRVAFVAGAFLASWSWQLGLAATGAVLHHRLPGRFQVAVSLLGNGIIAWFAFVIASGS